MLVDPLRAVLATMESNPSEAEELNRPRACGGIALAQDPALTKMILDRFTGKDTDSDGYPQRLE